MQKKKEQEVADFRGSQFLFWDNKFSDMIQAFI